ncbi:MAG: complex I subunit 5 family protein [Kiritimatiellia bacterium]|nr:hypothetical protein [Lentisphaerota bacterium]
MNLLPVWLVLLPLFLALLTALAGGWKTGVRILLAGIGGAGYLTLSLIAADMVRRHGPLIYFVGGWGAPLGIGLRLDEFAVIFQVVLGLGLAATLAFILRGRGYVAAELPLLFLLTAAAAGMLLADDLFNLFVFVELASVCSVALIALRRRGPQVTAGFNYLVFTALSSMIFLLALMIIYGATGHLNMGYVAARIANMPPLLYTAAVAGIVTAFGTKIGLIPLHFWQPAAYAAAGCSRAGFLSGVVMKIHICALLRLLWYPLDVMAQAPALATILLVLGSVNVIAGHCLALAQNDLKRMLAFSSVAHVGYILMGVGAGTVAGMIAGLYHVVNHFMMKTALFWSSRAMLAHARSSDLRRLQGAATAAPAAFIGFFVAALAIVGAPPSGGFFSKWLIALAASEGRGLWPVLVIAAGTLISLAYYGRVFCYALRSSTQPAGVSGRGSVPPLLMAAGCLMAGLAGAWLLPWLERAAVALFTRTPPVVAVMLRLMSDS